MPCPALLGYSLTSGGRHLYPSSHPSLGPSSQVSCPLLSTGCHPHFASVLAGVNVTMPSQPGVPPLSSTQLQIDPALQEFQLVDLSRRFLVHDAFWALPKQFLGNKVRRVGPAQSCSP